MDSDTTYIIVYTLIGSLVFLMLGIAIIRTCSFLLRKLLDNLFIPSSSSEKAVDTSKHWYRTAATLADESMTYPVTYRYGHKGIDHYLRMYIKRDSIPGRLTLSDDGIHFVCTQTPTTQKFKLSWHEVWSAAHDIEQGWHSDKTWLRVNTKKYGTLGFITSEAARITSEISYRVEQHKKELARQKKLEEMQIRARNLDAISPLRFEQLVGQLFLSIGYQVSETGGPGDEGIDLICRNVRGEKVAIQCKRYKHKIGVGIVRDFFGALIHSRAKRGFIVTTSEFTTPALEWAEGTPIELIDRRRLAELLERHYPL